MKIYFSLALLLLSACTSKISTDPKKVKKVVTIDEYSLLNNDFNQHDITCHERTISKYDKDGNKLEEKGYWGADQKYKGGMLYEYNDKGKLSRSYWLEMTEDKVNGTFSYVYEGNTRKEYAYYKTNSLTRKYLSSCNFYDSLGNIEKIIEYGYNNKASTEVYYKYDAAKREIAHTSTDVRSGLKLSAAYRSYDGNGNLKTLTVTDSVGGKVIHYEEFTYEGYDTKGNWKVRKSFEGNKPYKIEFQKVEYK